MILLALMCLFTPLSAFPKCNVGEHLEINLAARIANLISR